jgi:hypothetical protein
MDSPGYLDVQNQLLVAAGGDYQQINRAISEAAVWVGTNVPEGNLAPIQGLLRNRLADSFDMPRSQLGE